MANQIDTAIKAATERLCAQFPSVDPEAVQRTVAETTAKFAGRPIRDFVPILVEREAARQLHDLGKRSR